MFHIIIQADRIRAIGKGIAIEIKTAFENTSLFLISFESISLSVKNLFSLFGDPSIVLTQNLEPSQYYF